MEEHYRFGNVEFHPKHRALWVDGRAVRLGGRAFDLLLALVRHADRVVTKDELYEALWPGTVVGPNNLQVHVWALRRALGATAIATVARRGYRFMLPVHVHADPSPHVVEPGMSKLLSQLRRCRLLTLTGGDARTRRAAALAVAQSFSARQGPWMLEPPDASAQGRVMRHLAGEMATSGGLVVLHDAHCVPALADFAAHVLALHAGVHLLLGAPGAQQLPGEVTWPLAPPGAAREGGAPLRWLARAA